jgi:hypothetical protein
MEQQQPAKAEAKQQFAEIFRHHTPHTHAIVVIITKNYTSIRFGLGENDRKR